MEVQGCMCVCVCWCASERVGKRESDMSIDEEEKRGGVASSKPVSRT